MTFDAEIALAKKHEVRWTREAEREADFETRAIFRMRADGWAVRRKNLELHRASAGGGGERLAKTEAPAISDAFIAAVLAAPAAEQEHVMRSLAALEIRKSFGSPMAL